jgi:hypothetical protein
LLTEFIHQCGTAVALTSRPGPGPPQPNTTTTEPKVAGLPLARRSRAVGRMERWTQLTMYKHIG